MDQARLKSLLSYDPETGVFRWTLARRGVKLGAECGRVSKAHGYRDIGLDGKLWRAHRLAVLYMTGVMPERDVDHENRIKHDNRWANLRLATESQNMANVGLQSDNSSGVHGVTWDKAREKWRAQICIDGVKRNLGRFATKDEAADAYRQAAIDAWGEFVPCA